MVEALSQADRFFLNLAFKRAKKKQAMAQRTIDETGKDVAKQRSRMVWEVLFLRPDPNMEWVAEWVLSSRVGPDGWFQTEYSRTRIILDNET